MELGPGSRMIRNVPMTYVVRSVMPSMRLVLQILPSWQDSGEQALLVEDLGQGLPGIEIQPREPSLDLAELLPVAGLPQIRRPQPVDLGLDPGVEALQAGRLSLVVLVRRR